MRRFRKLLAEVLKISPASDTIKKLDCTIQLGNLALAPGEEYPVYMILVDRRNFFKDDVSTLLFKLKTPFIVTTGTRMFWDEGLVEVLRERNIPLLALSEALEFRDGQFVPTDVWHGAIESFRKTLHPENMVAMPEYEFRKMGQGWVIRFEGNDTFIKDGIGPNYISLLLRKPKTPIFASDLQAIAAGQKPEHTQRVSSGHKSDAATLEQIHKRYNELVAELEEAKQDHNNLLEKEICDEIEKLMNYLAEATGWDGYVKKEIDEAEKIRQAVYRAIQRTIILLEELLPECAEHLEDAIETGFTINYMPSTPVEWIL